MRAFFAIYPPQKIRFLLEDYQKQLQNLLGKGLIRWVHPPLFHITLLFVGDVEKEKIERLFSLHSRISFSAPFLESRSLSFFPNSRNPRVVSVAFSEKGGSLVRARQIIQNALAQEGIEYDQKPFVPHVTLGRVKRGICVRIPASYPEFPPCGWEAGEILLVESELHPKGPRYIPRMELPFQKDTAAQRKQNKQKGI